MHAAVEIISVAQAKELLERNKINRTLRPRLVSRYAEDMRSGRWHSNGQTVVISVDGNLLDGQHRMHAIVMAQLPCAMLVVRGVDQRAFSTIDTGAARTLADVLSSEKCLYAAHVAGIARAAYAYLSGVQYKANPNKTVLYEFVGNHPYLYDVAKMVANSPKSHWSPCPLGSVLFLANEGRQLDAEVSSFLDALRSGEGLWKGDPRLTLREWYLATRSPDHKGLVRSETVFAASARAWNAYASGNQLSALRGLDSPTRRSMSIFGFDKTLYLDVPVVASASTPAVRSNIAGAPKPVRSVSGVVLSSAAA
jgi:hypothetical protein